VVEIPKDLVCEFRRRALASQAEFSEIISNVVIELLTSMFGFLPSSLTVLAVERDRVQRPDRRNKSNHKEDSAHSIPTSLPTSPIMPDAASRAELSSSVAILSRRLYLVS
jgi:hypothetical protein